MSCARQIYLQVFTSYPNCKDLVIIAMNRVQGEQLSFQLLQTDMVGAEICNKSVAMELEIQTRGE